MNITRKAFSWNFEFPTQLHASTFKFVRFSPTSASYFERRSIYKVQQGIGAAWIWNHSEQNA
jgi:hypothetical protein